MRRRGRSLPGAPPRPPRLRGAPGGTGRGGGGARAPGLGARSGLGGVAVGEAPSSARQVGGGDGGGGRRCRVHDNRVTLRAGTWS